MIEILDEENYEKAVFTLAGKDADLANIVENFGIPPTWFRVSGFPTLVHIILEQQVSLASAKACFDKLNAVCEPLTPENFLRFSDEELKKIGFSRQKTLYSRELANAVLNKTLDWENLSEFSDEKVRAELTRIKGIGNWTADIYLLMSLLRPDVMPKGDLALHVAWKNLNNLPNRPTSDEFLEIAERWKPNRAVAARLLWHFYLCEKRQKS